ncbi:hypothetical protein [Roseateles sp. P5_D6]
MHKSLTPRANLLLIAGWLAVTAVAIYLGWPEARYATMLTFCIGSFAGAAQAQALSLVAEELKQTESAMQVRKTLYATKGGRLSVLLLWAVSVSALIWAFAMGVDKGLILFVASYSAFALARELVALPAVFRLQR